jgi:aminoglycoside phosphotransferase (APT) family kinase protein
VIDALSEAYKEMVAVAMGIPAGQVSILMIHRPHEDKDYADQSVYLIFLAGERFPSAVGKVGFDPAGAHYLEREHRGLRSLTESGKSLPAASVPRLLHYGQVAGRQALLQSALRGEKVSTWLTPGMRPSGRLSRFLEWAAAWSAALGRATRTDGASLVPAWIEEFSVKIDRTGRSRALLEGAARRVSVEFGGAFPAVLAQGDFCGENILGDGERYGVIDWELCDEHSIPTYDIVDLCLWVAFRTEGHLEPDPFAALERLLHGRDPLARELRCTLGRYAAAMGLQQDLLPPLVSLAWAGYCLKKFQHLRRDETGHFARARMAVRKILDTPAEILSGSREAE